MNYLNGLAELADFQNSGMVNAIEQGSDTQPQIGHISLMDSLDLFHIGGGDKRRKKEEPKQRRKRREGSALLPPSSSSTTARTSPRLSAIAGFSLGCLLKHWRKEARKRRNKGGEGREFSCHQTPPRPLPDICAATDECQTFARPPSDARLPPDLQGLEILRLKEKISISDRVFDFPALDLNRLTVCDDHCNLRMAHSSLKKAGKNRAEPAETEETSKKGRNKQNPKVARWAEPAETTPGKEKKKKKTWEEAERLLRNFISQETKSHSIQQSKSPWNPKHPHNKTWEGQQTQRNIHGKTNMSSHSHGIVLSVSSNLGCERICHIWS
ncbi:hypothetical protein M5K25_002576 [Dendrobium thyrsiflorum]|uniref:Uncharacterized protein n=1 Tax=Dendrobium thyrsiflorum TaxID=117978 RepID=A0ABD0VN15_DENTH